jgi:hypothetical protein
LASPPEELDFESDDDDDDESLEELEDSELELVDSVDFLLDDLLLLRLSVL